MTYFQIAKQQFFGWQTGIMAKLMNPHQQKPQWKRYLKLFLTDAVWITPTMKTHPAGRREIFPIDFECPFNANPSPPHFRSLRGENPNQRPNAPAGHALRKALHNPWRHQGVVVPMLFFSC